MIDPIIITIFGINIYWYGLVYALGFLFTIYFTLKFEKQIGTSKQNIENTLLYTMIFAVLGGRLFHIIFYEPIYFLSNPIQILRFDNGGMSIHGGLVFGTISLYYFSKKYKFNLFKLTDILVIPLSLVLAFGRIANFINQELVGKPTNSLFGVNFNNYQEKRHPSQIYESIKNMLTFQIISYLYFIKKLKTGLVTAWFLILYNWLRFLVDFSREPEVLITIISMGQLLSLIGTIFGICILIKLKN